MKTLREFFKTDLSLMNTVIGLCFAFIASCPMCAIAENEHPTGEQWFSAYFLAGIMLAAAVFFFGMAIHEFNDSRKVR